MCQQILCVSNPDLKCKQIKLQWMSLLGWLQDVWRVHCGDHDGSRVDFVFAKEVIKSILRKWAIKTFINRRLEWNEAFQVEWENHFDTVSIVISQLVRQQKMNCKYYGNRLINSLSDITIKRIYLGFKSLIRQKHLGYLKISSYAGWWAFFTLFWPNKNTIIRLYKENNCP